MQLDLLKIKIEPEELFQAYFNCRKNKRKTANALSFEIDYESNLLKLGQEINSGNYSPGQSISFIIEDPVKREIFAANFKDRVVHHLLINKLNPLFEKIFIHDSYSCRKDKGTHYGIKRVDKFIRKCSQNYTHDCYILKLDIQGFFMSINKKILFKKIEKIINQNYHLSDKEIIRQLCFKIIFNNPTKNCFIKGRRKNWLGLPKNKSLFFSSPDCGLPIGNLTSQIFANVYLNDFDHFVKKELQIKYYGRYVDDFVIIHQDKEYLKKIIKEIKLYLKNNLKLTLHPKKIYLQDCLKGVKFLGIIIKPYRKYINKRIKNNFFQALEKQNRLIKNHKPSPKERFYFLSMMNSYLGILKHYQTYFLKKKILNQINLFWKNYFYFNQNKFILKNKRV